MSISVSSLPGSIFLICQRGQLQASSAMRLPSVNELFKMTDRLSERNRMFGHHTSPQMNTQVSSESFIDLTSDSSQDTFNPPDFDRYSVAGPSYPDHSVDSGYIDLEYLGMSQRRSREPTIVRSRPHKRRRRVDSDDCLVTISSPTNTTPTISLLSSPSADSSNQVGLSHRKSSQSKEVADVGALSSTTTKRKASMEPLQDAQEGEESKSKDQQDRQLADTIKAQAGISQGTSKLNQLTCIICMDSMTNITATKCGHIFCHSCIMEALIAGENRADGRQVPKCPMCRTRIHRKVTNRAPEVVPLALKVKSRGKTAMGKQKEVLSQY